MYALMIVALATHAMGTRFEIVLEGAVAQASDTLNEAHLRAVGEEVISEIRDWHQRLNLFSRDSDIARINRLAAREPVHVDPELFELLKTCGQLTVQTSGAFDITVGPLMRALFSSGHSGEGPGDRSAHTPIIDRAGAGAATGVCGMRHLQLDESGHTVRFEHDGMAIDLGGIAKGFVLDRAAEIVRSHGVERAFIHGGTSTAIALGSPANQEAGYTVAIRPPGCQADDTPQWTVSLRDAALSVSAPHGRTTRNEDGESIGHIIDPRNSAAVQHALLAAAVCDSALHADAWSTALLVLGRLPTFAPTSLSSLIVHRAADHCVSEWSTAGACPSIFRAAQAQPSETAT